MTENQTKTTDNLHTDDIFALLSDNQWRFVTAMVDNPSFSKKEAAEHIGLLPDTVYRWGNIVNEAVEKAREDVHEAALSMRKRAVLKALRVKISLLDSEEESIRSKAATEIIEWELGKSTQPTELTGKNGGAIETKDVSLDDDTRLERIASLLDKARARRDGNAS